MKAHVRKLLLLIVVLALVVAGVAVPVRWHRRAKVYKTKLAGHAFKRPAQPVVLRSGLPNLREKLKAGAPVVIAFIGGSITQNAGSGGFVTEVPAWLGHLFPGAQIKTINAGIAATGSDFGAQRVDRDVLVHRPDLVFVEFAVNDAARACEADMERLVRKLRMASPQPEIVLIYTISRDTLTMLQNGKFPSSVKQHEIVAERYGVPTVALGYEAARKIREGEWTWAEFASDVCHPTPAGYGSYNSDIDAALAVLLNAGTAGVAPLPPPLTPSLVVYPPPAKAVAIAAPQPMGDANGVTAKRTDALPLFGVNWIGAPEFASGAETLWRLDFRAIDAGAPVDAAVGQDRGGWTPAVWFDEARRFTGRTSHALARSDAQGNFFGTSPFDEPRLTWRASVAGHYKIHVTVTGVEGKTATEHPVIGLNIVRFPAGLARGESLGMQFSNRDEPFDFRTQTLLSAGDEIALVIHSSGYKFAGFRGFCVEIGLFGSEGKE